MLVLAARRRRFADIALVLILSAIAGSCGGSDSSQQGGTATPPITNPPATPPSSAGQAPTFTQINTEIIQPRCISCHSDSNAENGISYSSYEGVMAQVTPGEPESSDLY